MNSSAAKRTPIGTISQGRIAQQKADHLAEVVGVQAPKWHRNPIKALLRSLGGIAWLELRVESSALMLSV